VVSCILTIHPQPAYTASDRACTITMQPCILTRYPQPVIGHVQAVGHVIFKYWREIQIMARNSN